MIFQLNKHLNLNLLIESKRLIKLKAWLWSSSSYLGGDDPYIHYAAWLRYLSNKIGLHLSLVVALNNYPSQLIHTSRTHSLIIKQNKMNSNNKFEKK